MTKRRISETWLDDYLRFTDNSESPISYHRWSAISILASALQRRTYMTRHHGIIYPNMYIILVGPSGRARKGEPLRIARSFLEKLNVTVLANVNSKESLIRDLSVCQNNFTDITTGRIMLQSAATCISEELAVFTGQQNMGLIMDLIDWYDCPDSFSYRTKNQGTDDISGLCFNMLAATDARWLPTILPDTAVTGGLTSRTIFVVEDKKRKTVADPDKFPVDEKLRANLLADLEIIMTLTGQFRFHKEAKDIYVAWYEKEDKLLNSDNHPIQDNNLEGYAYRRATHLYKLCMCLSAARDNHLSILAEDIHRAIGLLEEIEPAMPKAFQTMGTTKYSKETQLLLNFIRGKGVLSKAAVMNKFPMTIDSVVYKAVTEDLAARKLVKLTAIPEKIEFIETSAVESQNEVEETYQRLRVVGSDQSQER